MPIFLGGPMGPIHLVWALAAIHPRWGNRLLILAATSAPPAAEYSSLPGWFDNCAFSKYSKQHQEGLTSKGEKYYTVDRKYFGMDVWVICLCL